jgi:23S rRNA (guanosine2251-2'-O)-methyltransferase
MEEPKNIVIYGRHPVVEAIKGGKTFEKILFQQGLTGEIEKEIRKLCREFQIPLSIVPREKLDKISNGANHQGVIGHIALLTYHNLEAVLPHIFEKGEIPLLLLLDGVTDVRNFGAIARSAEVMGVHAIVVPQKGGALINAEALKASAGALNRIPVCREKTMSGVLDYLGSSGVRIIASDLKATQRLFEVDFTLPTAILIGSEDEGVNMNFIRRSDETFVIPQAGETDSLNVSVATGIILYEVVKQRLRTVQA